jgi:hypothetical protein
MALLFRAVSRDGALKHPRDRALLGLQALRTVEITRANVTDWVLPTPPGPASVTSHSRFSWSAIRVNSSSRLMKVVSRDLIGR